MSAYGGFGSELREIPAVLCNLHCRRSNERHRQYPLCHLRSRNTECNVALPYDGQVSRQHCRMVWDGISWQIEDCGSKNGVYVNGMRASTQVIRTGDEIRVGQSTMRVV